MIQKNMKIYFLMNKKLAIKKNFKMNKWNLK